MRKLLSIIILLNTWIIGLKGQQAELSSQLDTNAILIGEQANLKLQLTLPLGQKALFPQFKDSLSVNLPIVKTSPIDSLVDEAQQHLLLSQTLTLTSFDTGYWRVPPIAALVYGTDSITCDTIRSLSTSLNVFTVAVDTTQDIKPIVAPIAQGYSLQEIFPWVLLSIGIITLLAIAWFYWQQRKGKLSLLKKAEKPALPPHEEALEALGELRHQKLWQQGLLKKYYTQLTDIVRHYIHRRFHINAMEMTSDEIMEHLEQDLQHNPQILQRLQATFGIADMVKFAKGGANAIENDGCWHNCVDFINETKLSIHKTEDSPAATEGKEVQNV